MFSWRSVFFTPQALYHAMSSIVHSPLGHQVTQEEVLICPSHTAVLANYSDLMWTLAGICGDARCYCTNLPAPSVAFIILNRLSFFVDAKETSLHWHEIWYSTRSRFVVFIWASGCVQFKSSTSTLHPRAFLPFAMFLWNQSNLRQARPHHHSIIFFGQLTNCKTNAYSVFQFRTF